MSEKHFTGAAGQFAVLAEFAFRGYTVSMPYPDEGEDCFVYDQSSARITLIQVKTARSRRRKNAHRYQFAISETQITTPRSPDIYFALVMRRADVFHPLIFSRADLHRHAVTNGFGTISNGNRVLSVSFSDANIVTFGAGKKKTDITKHLRDYGHWPQLIPSALKPFSSATDYLSPW